MEVTSPITPENAYNTNPKMKKWGVLCLILPFLLLIATLTAYAVSQSVINNMLSAPTAPTPTPQVAPGLEQTFRKPDPLMDQRLVTARIVNLALSLVGMLSVVSMFVLLPLGIMLLVRSRGELKPGVPYDERSGKGDASIVPPEIHGWNWGAGLLSFWWGIYHSTWIVFVSFVPVIGGFWWIVMGVKGNEWAWRKNKWLSVAHFKSSQRKWATWAIGITCGSIFLSLILIVGTALSSGL